MILLRRFIRRWLRPLLFKCVFAGHEPRVLEIESGALVYICPRCMVKTSAPLLELRTRL